RHFRRLRRAHRRDHKLAQRRPTQSRCTHQPRHALAAHTDLVIIRQLRMDHRRAIRLARAAVDLVDPSRERDIGPLPSRHRALLPSIEAARGHFKQSAHNPYRVGGLVRLHESEERFGVAGFSVANQAAAFARISRSSLSLRFSRRSRVSSSRSALVKPPSPLPRSRASCLTHSEIVQAVGPNSRDSSAGVRPLRTKSTIWRLNSGAYRTVFFSAIVNPSKPYVEVSTQAGQLQIAKLTAFSVRRRPVPARCSYACLPYGRYSLGSGAVADSACTMMPVTRQPPASLIA